MAFSLAISRIFDEPELMTSENKEIQEEFLLRKSMLTAVTFLVLFTVFVQVRNLVNSRNERHLYKAQGHVLAPWQVTTFI